MQISKQDAAQVKKSSAAYVVVCERRFFQLQQSIVTKFALISDFRVPLLNKPLLTS